MRIVGIIQARFDSSRLPGKALMITKSGKPLLGYIIERAKRIRGLSSIILATTERPVDLQLCNYAEKQNIEVFRGSLDDVASRMLNCALTWNSDYFIRLNGDSPFLDLNLIEKGIEACNGSNVDLITNLIGRTYPYGISVEIIRTDTYQRIYSHFNQPEYHEHITQYFYSHIEQFNILQLVSQNQSLCKAHLVVDTIEDWHVFESIVEQLGEDVFQAGYEHVAKLYLKLKGIPIEI